MLRGMGWKAGDGIGKTRKGVTAPVEAAVRPKGLGLGADRSVKIKDVKQKPLKPGDKRPEEEESLVLKTGAHVVVESGKHKDLYGVVEGNQEQMSSLHRRRSCLLAARAVVFFILIFFPAGLDEDNCRVVVKLSISSAAVSVPQAVVKVVTRKVS